MIDWSRSVGSGVGRGMRAPDIVRPSIDAAYGGEYTLGGYHLGTAPLCGGAVPK